MVGRIDGDVSVRTRELWLDGCDAVIVRGIPRGSLEQVIFRVDALHALVERGVTCVNGPRAIERTVDKFLASALLARAGVPTPRTIACERPEDALEAFEELGGDVIVKPLFGAMGAGMTRVDDADVAYRVFEALALERAVYYLQEALPHDGRDVRALVVGGRVPAAIERVGTGWRANLARGARAQATQLSAEQERLCLDAARALGVEYAGVDLAARRRRARLRARAQRDPGLARPSGGDGLRRGGGARRPRRGARQRSSASSARADDAAVHRGCDERAGRAGGGERAQVVDVAHAAPGEQLEVGERRVDRADQRHVRPRAAAHPREVEHDRLAQAGAVQLRHGVERGQPREPCVGRQQAAVAQVDAQDHGAVGELGEQAVERAGAAQRLGPDDDAVRAEVQQRPRPPRLADAGVDHHARLARQRADARAVLACPADRIEVGDVQLVEPQRGPERARQGQRVAVVAGEGAADRAVAFALAAHGVDRRAGFEIDDRDDAQPARRRTLALDIGGANTKAAWLDGQSLRTVSRAFEVWRDRAALSAVLRDVAAEVAGGPPYAVAITMTAELSDAFRTKREGVAFVLDAAQDALGARPLRVLTVAGELVPVEAARARPWDVAAANWVATALAVADAHPDALLIDVGSTTADVVPIAAGRVAATGRNDLERLLAGELVYTGRAAHQPRGDRAARAGPRRSLPGVVRVLRDQRRRPSRPRPPGAGGVRLPHARRPPGDARVRA